MAKRLLLITLLSCFLVSTYVYSEETKPNNSEELSLEDYSPILTIETVIQKAKNYAISKGSKLEDYFISSVKYDHSDKKWTVFFEGEKPIYGHFFRIDIEDKTGTIEYFPGE